MEPIWEHVTVSDLLQILAYAVIAAGVIITTKISVKNLEKAVGEKASRERMEAIEKELADQRSYCRKQMDAAINVDLFNSELRALRSEICTIRKAQRDIKATQRRQFEKIDSIYEMILGKMA